VVVSWVSSPIATWSTLIALLSIHLATNNAAVKAVSLTVLNRQRANIVFSNIFQYGRVMSPKDVSGHERVFERDGVLRWCDDEVVGWARIGVGFKGLLGRMGKQHEKTGSTHLQGVGMEELLDVFGEEAYVLWPASSSSQAALIVLKEGCTPIDQLRAWAHALLLAKRLREQGDVSPLKDRFLTELRGALKDTREVFEKNVDALKEKGWDLDVAALETRAGTRVQIDSGKH
jgi:hypothetical protein